MTPPKTTHDPLAGASQSAAEVASRAVGAPGNDEQPRAQGDGYYTDPADGVRRKIRAGDPVPAGAELEGTSAKSADKPDENKSRSGAENK